MFDCKGAQFSQSFSAFNLAARRVSDYDTRHLNNAFKYVLFVLVSHSEAKQLIRASRHSGQLGNTGIEFFLQLCHAFFALGNFSFDLTRLFLRLFILFAKFRIGLGQLSELLTHLRAGNSSLTSSCLSMSNCS